MIPKLAGHKRPQRLLHIQIGPQTFAHKVHLSDRHTSSDAHAPRGMSALTRLLLVTYWTWHSGESGSRWRQPRVQIVFFSLFPFSISHTSHTHYHGSWCRLTEESDRFRDDAMHLPEVRRITGPTRRRPTNRWHFKYVQQPRWYIITCQDTVDPTWRDEH